MEYTFKEQPKEKKTFSAENPRPVLDDGQYLCRIIHAGRVDYAEAKNEKGDVVENAGLRFTLVPVDREHEDVRIRERVHLWHRSESTRFNADRKLKMICDFAGLPRSGKINFDELVGRRVGLTVERVSRFDDAGKRIEFNEVKRWHAGPDKRAQNFSPKSTPTNRTDAPSQDASFDSLFGP